MKQIKVASVFSGGLAAPEFALKYLDIPHEVVFAAEIDKFARQQYIAFHGNPSDEFYEDVRKINGTKYANEIDLFVGGSPCQSFSLAGKRRGFEDTRGTLFFEYARLVQEMQPKVFIYENVKGMLSHDEGKTFDVVMATFKELGYHTSYKVLNTKHYNIPQNRERIYVVGFKDSKDYTMFDFAPKQDLTYKLKDLLETDVDEKYYIKDETYLKFITDCLTSVQKDNYVIEPKILYARFGELVGASENIANCLTTSCGHSSLLTGQKIKYLGRIRKFTPRECYRLQGVHDEDIDNIVVSNSQAYKIAGNAMSVNVLEMLLYQIYLDKKLNVRNASRLLF